MTARRLLDDVMVAAPCNVGWENMQGDERVRFCNLCQLNVYNLSGMSDKEAEELLQISDSKICISLYRRADGTVMTDNCPVGLRKIREKLLNAGKRGGLAKIAACAALFLLGLPAAADEKKSVPLLGSPCPPQNSGDKQPVYPRTGGIMMPVKPENGSDKKADIQVQGEADATAFKLYTLAKQNERNGNLLVAEINYKKALEAAGHEKHDPKFRAKIRKDYAKFLSRQNREKEARELPQ